ncbi:MAG: phosphatidylinositol-specific phospholipase C1-like protein [Pseudomonadales bacterium]|nr:phosphatidylinositol-specific phospholipase C1-like protein [Pseudomonadales bacterium]
MTRIPVKQIVACASALVLAACSILPPGEARRLNEIQFVGSHNSYKKAIDAPVMAAIAADDAGVAASLDYAHLPLARQLDLGMRTLELDVYYDPEGGRYASPLGVTTIEGATPYDPDGEMKRPGFKVMHVQDIDFRSHCPLLRECLDTIRTWSVAHPDHLPLFVSINAKSDVIDRPGFVRPLPFDEAAFDALDAEIRFGMGELLIEPDEIRGRAKTLREAVLSGWPRLDKVRGRILFVLDDSAAKKATYVAGHPSLAGRAMFIDASEEAPEASIRVVNDPVARGAYIRSLVRQGFIVRTRADADTVEARSGDTSRLEAALASGAQIISTDYYVPDERLDTGYVARLPRGVVARCNPVLVSRDCEVNSAGE